MASDPELQHAEETVVVDADAVAAANEEWPVADLYRVEPEEAPPAGPAEAETVAIPAPAAPSAPRIVVPLLAILAAVGAVLLLAFLLGSRGPGQPAQASEGTTMAPATPSTTEATASAPAQTLPNVVGTKAADARRVLDKLHLRVRVTTARSEREPGIVVRQDPAQGTTFRRGGVVTLVVSKGAPSQVRPSLGVPSLVGLSASDAVVAVRDAGFVATIQLVASTARAGTVVRQSPTSDAAAARGSTITLDVAKARAAPERVEVPDLVGMDAADARQRLAQLGLAVSVLQLSSPQPVGTVLRQSPRSGAELEQKGRVTLTVSSGPRKVDVPDVTGLDEESARGQLESAGFEVRVAYEPTSDPAQDGLVTRQTPVGSSAAAEGSVVTIVVAQLG